MKTLLSLILLFSFVGSAESVVFRTGYLFYVRPNVKPIYEGVIPWSFYQASQCGEKCEKNPNCVVAVMFNNQNICRLYPLVPNLDLIPYPGATEAGREVWLMVKLDMKTNNFYLMTHHLGNKKFRYNMSENLFQVREVK
uniref:Apple domain-containing protein n=1 Tax=Caenorhabditis tropicalis TaxID=1561998 RepID=A0A1I7UWK6_9PELO